MRAPNDLYLSRRDIIKPADVVVVVVAYTSTYIYIYKSVRIIYTQSQLRYTVAFGQFCLYWNQNEKAIITNVINMFTFRLLFNL